MSNPFVRTLNRIRGKWAFERAMTDFDRRVCEARRQHKPTRHIEAERREFVHGCLRGSR